MTTDNYWLVIDTLLSTIENGADENLVKDARLRLAMDLDKRVVCNLPTDETKRLISALNRLADKVA